MVTGMSGVGKSSIAAALTARGYLAVDTDRDASRIAEGGERLWDKHELDRLRSADQAQPLFIADSASNQTQFYRRCPRSRVASAVRTRPSAEGPKMHR